jgi:hypothetical protein
MPYVPAEDRPVLDEKVNALAEKICDVFVEQGSHNLALAGLYTNAVFRVGELLFQHTTTGDFRTISEKQPEDALAKAIVDVAKHHGYEGATLGEFNYAITRLIQVVPAKLVERKVFKDEFRYWLYAATAGSLEQASYQFSELGANLRSSASQREISAYVSIAGVINDVKDEYKRRVNTAYEAVQIVKSGDCYDTPYRTELIRREDGGFTEVMRDLKNVPREKRMSRQA